MLQVLENMVDLVGIEPATSSMPWKVRIELARTGRRCAQDLRERRLCGTQSRPSPFIPASCTRRAWFSSTCGARVLAPPHNFRRLPRRPPSRHRVCRHTSWRERCLRKSDCFQLVFDRIERERLQRPRKCDRANSDSRDLRSVCAIVLCDDHAMARRPHSCKLL